MGKSRNRKWFDRGETWEDTKKKQDFDSRRKQKKNKQHTREHYDEDEEIDTRDRYYGKVS